MTTLYDTTTMHLPPEVVSTREAIERVRRAERGGYRVEIRDDAGVIVADHVPGGNGAYGLCCCHGCGEEMLARYAVSYNGESYCAGCEAVPADDLT